MWGQAERGVNKKGDHVGLSNNEVEGEIVEIEGDSLGGTQETGQGVRHHGERMEVDTATHINAPKRLALQVLDHNRMPGTISAKKGDGISTQGTWKRLSKGDHSEGHELRDSAKENNWGDNRKGVDRGRKGELT